LFVTLRGGLQSLVSALVERLPPGALRLNSSATSISLIADADTKTNPAATAADPRWRVTWRATDSNVEHEETFDSLIVAAPAPRSGELLAPSSPALADELGHIEYAGSAVVLAGYQREQIAHALDASGFVVPAIEGRRILACSFASAKYRDRAPPGHVLLRVFVGGASDPSAVELPDAELRKIVTNELGVLIGLRGEPCFWHVARWRRSMPQYHLGHCERVARLDALAAELPGLALAGNAFRGVGIPACIASGEAAAERLLAAHGKAT
jgi:oxygen-dependent protoporphyrinogen oxidase